MWNTLPLLALCQPALSLSQTAVSVQVEDLSPGAISPAQKDAYEYEYVEDQNDKATANVNDNAIEQQYCPPRYYVKTDAAQLGWTLGPERSHAANGEPDHQGPKVLEGSGSTPPPPSMAKM